MEPPVYDLFREAARRNASDLFVKAGSPPSLRIDGITSPLESPTLMPEDTENLLTPLLRPRDHDILTNEQSVNMARAIEGAGRFRIIIYSQQGTLAMVARRIRTDVPAVEDLGLPLVLNAIARERTGLVLVTGATGSGKSTTLAAMLNQRNATCTGHIVTVEDPIEFVHTDRQSLVTQRELGLDCENYERALQDALRQAPDVLFIGEIRERSVMEQALHFAETGHLVLSTLHSTNANQALERILGFFPPESHPQIQLQLSLSVRAILSQRLLPRLGGEGRIAAMEVLIATQRARDLIREGDSEGLKHLMRNSAAEGMMTFDQCLYELCRQRLIAPETGLANADSPADLRMRLRGFEALSVT